MDSKITKRRLNDLLSYDWLKIVAIIILGVLVFSIIFTTTAVRVKTGQNFATYFYADVRYGDKYQDFSNNLKKNNVLSYDVLINGGEKFEQKTVSTIFPIRLTVHEGDIVFTTNTFGKDKDDKPIYSNFKSLVDTHANFYAIDELMTDAENYYTAFYQLENQKIKLDKDGNGIFNQIYLNSRFKERMKGDNRYKNKAQIDRGIIDEMNRIEKLRKSHIELKEKFKVSPNLLVDYSRFEQKLEIDTKNEDKLTVQESKPYGIDLSGIPNITDLVKNTDGTNKDLILLVFNWKKYQEDLQYEAIPVILEYLNYKK